VITTVTTQSAGTELAPLRLRVHIIWYGNVQHPYWFVDIDDDDDRQPDDPYWCMSCCTCVEDALAAGCAQLAAMYEDLDAVRVAGRISRHPDTPQGESELGRTIYRTSASTVAGTSQTRAAGGERMRFGEHQQPCSANSAGAGSDVEAREPASFE
jgi:hypothetical protein